MAQPTSNAAHVDAILTNISVAYMQRQDHYIADTVFRQIPVDKQSDLYYVYDRNDFLRDEAQQRADLTESAGGGYKLATDGYLCPVFAFHKDIGDQMRANADNVIQPEADATRFVTNKLLLRKEIDFVTKFFAPAIWATDVTPTNLWSDYTLSEPKEDIKVGKKTILTATGYEPNTLVVGYEVWQALEDHPHFTDQVKYTSSQSLSEEMVARMLGLDKVVVAKAIVASNLEGEAEVYQLTHGKHALLCYSNPQPSLMSPSAGYQFVWRGVSQGLGTPVAVRQFRMEHLRGTRVEGEAAFAHKLISADLGYFFNAVVS